MATKTKTSCELSGCSGCSDCYMDDLILGKYEDTYNPVVYTGTAIMYGNWISGSDVKVQYMSQLKDGRTVYLVENDGFTKMVAIKDENSSEGKYYTGKVEDFHAEKWNTYTNAGNNYLIREQPVE